MRIILQKDVKNLGQAGDIVSVKKGYARHLLFPQKSAIPFTEGSARASQHRKEMILAKKKKALNLRKSLAEKLKDTKLSFIKSADSSGKLFGSVTALEILRELQRQGFEVDKKAIKLEQPLKEIGQSLLLLDLGSDLKVEINVSVSSQNIKKEEEQMEEEL